MLVGSMSYVSPVSVGDADQPSSPSSQAVRWVEDDQHARQIRDRELLDSR